MPTKGVVAAPSLHQFEEAIKTGDPNPHPRLFAGSTVGSVLNSFTNDDLKTLGRLHGKGGLASALNLVFSSADPRSELNRADPAIKRVFLGLPTSEFEKFRAAWNKEKTACVQLTNVPRE